MSEHNKAKRAIDAEIERLAMRLWIRGHKDPQVSAWAAVKANVAIGDAIRSVKK